MQYAHLATFFVIEHKGDGNARFARPLRMRGRAP